ncbi:hypothetical protein AB2B38_008460 [Balneola sp. MJW-20]|uniref:hypothetical protein n=1 Tax=Gracilimonas aurantiaca TaxID=3234185 RepID=UPI0034657E0B
MRDVVLWVVMFVFFYSCQSGLQSDGGEVDSESRYSINSQELGVLSGVETDWNLSSGIAVLGPEETGEPLGRLEFTLRQGSVDLDSIYIERAVFSWSNLRSGNPSAVDARLYSLSVTQKQCRVTSINVSNVTVTGPSGNCVLDLVRIDQNGAGESLQISFFANAVD